MATKQTIQWKKPKDIEFGEALGDKQLNATLDKGDGKLTYSPGKGEKLRPGKHTLTVTASKTKEFEETTEEVELVVTKAKQVIEWKDPADITYGDLLGSKQLNARLKEGDGDLVYDPKEKAKLDAGKHTLKVRAKAGKEYDEAEAEVKLVVNKAEQEIVWKEPKSITYGELLGDDQFTAVLKVGDGKLTYDRKAGLKPPGGKHTLKVTAAATDNYKETTAEVTLVVEPAEQLLEGDLPKTFKYGESFLVTKGFKPTRVSGNPVVTPAHYLKDFSLLKPGKHKFTLTLPANDNFKVYTRVFEFEVLEPPAITVDDWMDKLGFDSKGNLYMKDLGVFGGAGKLTAGKGKELHLSIFKKQLPDDVSAMCTPEQVRDTLFPSKGALGFHITLEFHQGETSLSNPHVYRDLNKMYKGQGVTYQQDEWDALEKKLTQRLDAELIKLKNAIVATKWCQG